MKHRTTGWRAAQAGVLGIVMLLAGAGVGQAELQKVEAVGIYGIHEAQRSRVVPRDEATAASAFDQHFLQDAVFDQRHARLAGCYIDKNFLAHSPFPR